MLLTIINILMFIFGVYISQSNQNIIYYSDGTQEFQSYYNKSLILPTTTIINSTNLYETIIYLQEKLNMILENIYECENNNSTYCKCTYFKASDYGNLHDIKIVSQYLCINNIYKNETTLEINAKSSFIGNPCNNYFHVDCDFNID